MVKGGTRVWSLERLVGLLDSKIRQTIGMLNKNTSARAYGIVLATVFAIMVTYLAYRIWENISLVLLIFTGLWVGFFLTGIWIFTREFPISGAERRRRNKQFYDWLRSQGRR